MIFIITLIFDVISKTYGSRDLAVLLRHRWLTLRGAAACSDLLPTCWDLVAHGTLDVWVEQCQGSHSVCDGVVYVYYFHVHTLKPCTFYTLCICMCIYIYILHIHSGLLHRFARIPSSIYFWGIPSQTNWMTQGFWTLPWLGWAKSHFFGVFWFQSWVEIAIEVFHVGKISINWVEFAFRTKSGYVSFEEV